MTDYRLKLLEFLEPLPNYKGNILPLVEEYLSEIHRHERTLFLDILKPLANNGYVKFPQETINGLTMLTALKYIHDDIIVRMTYESHDYLEELRKKKNPSPQPVIDMSQEEET